MLDQALEEEGDGSEIRELINLMNRLRPSAENIPSIKNNNAENFHLAQIVDSQTFTRHGGNLPRVSTLLGHTNTDEKCYAMLVVLAHLLPAVATSRCSVRAAITRLLDSVPVGSTVASLYNASQDPVQSIQPQLACFGPLRRESQQYLIVAKPHKIAIPLDKGLACAVDKLFKPDWVCNLAYPAPLNSVFSFFEYIYDLPMSTNYPRMLFVWTSFSFVVYEI